MFERVRADIARVTASEPTLAHRAIAVGFNLGLHAVLLYRLSHSLHRRGLSLVGVAVSYVSSIVTGAQISRRATIGKGLSILHPAGVVIGATTVIGDDCTIVGGNVIGQLRGTNDRPTIGHHFFAGTGACILGRITIGDHVRVGANSVVLQSLPARVTAVGVPARIIARRTLRLAHRAEAPVFERVRAVLQRIGVRMDELSPDMPLVGEGVGLDSVGMLEFACALEEEFQLVDLPLSSAEVFATVDSLCRFLIARETQPIPASATRRRAFR
jgi:serine O-acetyltransferase